MPDAQERTTTVIEPRNALRPVDLVEIWEYRELLWFIALRDLRVRYRQTFLGIAWSALQPIALLCVFSLAFGRSGGAFAAQGGSYILFAACGLLPWQLFAQTLAHAGGSIIDNERLVTKVYFPRLVLPLAAVLVSLVDFAVAGCLVGILLAYHGLLPGAQVLLLPAFVGLALAAALALGTWLAALSAEYRDFRHVIPLLTQVLLLASPIAYPTTVVPERWQALYALNPMVGAIEGIRWCLLPDVAPPGWPMLFASMGMALVLLVGGTFAFRRLETRFADVL